MKFQSFFSVAWPSMLGACLVEMLVFAVIDPQGNVAAYTGPKATEWAGDKQGKYCTAQGNILAGPEVVSEMVRAFESTGGHLSFRLLAALEAGDVDVEVAVREGDDVAVAEALRVVDQRKHLGRDAQHLPGEGLGRDPGVGMTVHRPFRHTRRARRVHDRRHIIERLHDFCG